MQQHGCTGNEEKNEENEEENEYEQALVLTSLSSPLQNAVHLMSLAHPCKHMNS